MSQRKINVAIVGLGFGAEFIPIYQRHPNANMYAICQRDPKKLDVIGDAFGVSQRYAKFADLLKDSAVEAVHINSPIPDHAWMSLAALRAGKHVSCTVPMATSISDCRKIVELVKRTGLKYMMAETVVYAREYLFMKELLDDGKLGRLQFVQASHQQDMDGWPNYWPGLPPMWYATHCVGPVAGLIGKPAEYVSCFGSGTIRKELIKAYGSPFAVETAHIKFKGTDVNARIIRSLFDTARQYRESIDVYGSKASVEWPLVEHEPLVMHTAKLPEARIPKPVKTPDFAKRLPKEIQPFTTRGVYDLGKKTHLSFTQGAGHGGSHPHLVNEFLMALVGKRDPFPNAKQSANWTCVGLCAHESALKGGAIVKLPAFRCDRLIRLICCNPNQSTQPTMSAKTEGIAPNASRLLWAGFMAILAAGVGFAIRGGIFDNWGAEYGFTAGQLGAIGGAGFSGFCFGIIIGGVICDKIGYGKLVILAFALHMLSAFVTFTAKGGSAYTSLYWGMFIFAYANGTLEAVANPLVATLFPNKRTHYLNILHASWPAGLVIGSVLGWILDDKMKLSWQVQLSLYLLPTLVYGVMFLGQHMPKSEASEKGLSFGEMFKDVGILGALIVCYLLSLFGQSALQIPAGVAYGIAGVLLIAVSVMTKFSIGSLLLFVLFVTHAMVGAVELGTDGWIQNITGNLFTSEQGKYLFMWTSAIMFSLRFCADFIEKRLGISPVGILLICASLASLGLILASNMTTIGVAFAALGVYAVGKTFFWPTMLAVASDRFPRTGAIAISIMGGIGMMSAGLIGSPGLGYAKDRFATEALGQSNPAALAQYKSANPSKFLFFSEASALDGTKLAEAQKVAAAERTPEQQAVVEASIAGDRKTLRTDAIIPAIMAVIYLLLLIYFKSIGGYKAVHLEGSGKAA